MLPFVRDLNLFKVFKLLAKLINFLDVRGHSFYHFEEIKSLVEQNKARCFVVSAALSQERQFSV